MSTMHDAETRWKRTNTDVNLSQQYLVRNSVDGRKTTGALSVGGANRSRVGNSSVESGHTGTCGTASFLQDISDRDIFDKDGV